MASKRIVTIYRHILIGTVLLFIVSLILADVFRLKEIQASAPELLLPAGILKESKDYNPLVLYGMKIDPDNPLSFEFIIDEGDTDLSREQLKFSTENLIKYFLAALAVPEEDLWVNLSPYESDRIITEELGTTEIGKEMLAQDYILKQLASSLTHPDTPTGRAYWQVVPSRAQASKKSHHKGHRQVESDRLSKIWIEPRTAEIFEHDGGVYISGASLDVRSESGSENVQSLLDAIKQQVNQGAHFARTRQIYRAFILAAYFKQKYMESLYSHAIDKNNVNGFALHDRTLKDRIYDLYVDAFKKRAYDVVKPLPYVCSSDKRLNRYFAGGENYAYISSRIMFDNSGSPASVLKSVSVRIVSSVSSAVDEVLPEQPQGNDVNNGLAWCRYFDNVLNILNKYTETDLLRKQYLPVRSYFDLRYRSNDHDNKTAAERVGADLRRMSGDISSRALFIKKYFSGIAELENKLNKAGLAGELVSALTEAADNMRRIMRRDYYVKENTVQNTVHKAYADINWNKFADGFEHKDRRSLCRDFIVLMNIIRLKIDNRSIPFAQSDADEPGSINFGDFILEGVEEEYEKYDRFFEAIDHSDFPAAADWLVTVNHRRRVNFKGESINDSNPFMLNNDPAMDRALNLLYDTRNSVADGVYNAGSGHYSFYQQMLRDLDNLKPVNRMVRKIFFMFAVFYDSSESGENKRIFVKAVDLFLEVCRRLEDYVSIEAQKIPEFYIAEAMEEFEQEVENKKAAHNVDSSDDSSSSVGGISLSRVYIPGVSACAVETPESFDPSVFDSFSFLIESTEE